MSGRRLDPQERALWQRLAQSVRAYHAQPQKKPLPQSVKMPDPQRTKIALPPAVTPVPVRHSVQPPAAITPKNLALDAATLDGNWDRRLVRGIVQPERTIDLHGYGLDRAYPVLMTAIARAKRDGVRVVLLITGRAGPAQNKGHNPRLPPTSRGVIRASVLDWLAASDVAASIAAVRPAHPRHGGAGAFYVILKADRKMRA